MGNVPQVLAVPVHRQVKAWADEFGPVFVMRFMWRTVSMDGGWGPLCALSLSIWCRSPCVTHGHALSCTWPALHMHTQRAAAPAPCHSSTQIVAVTHPETVAKLLRPGPDYAPKFLPSYGIFQRVGVLRWCGLDRPTLGSHRACLSGKAGMKSPGGAEPTHAIAKRTSCSLLANCHIRPYLA